MFGFGWEKNTIWEKTTKLKRWSIFLDFFKNACVVQYGGPPRGEKLVTMDQIMQKLLVKGYNLASWKFQTKIRKSIFHLMSQFVLFEAQSALVYAVFCDL